MSSRNALTYDHAIKINQPIENGEPLGDNLAVEVIIKFVKYIILLKQI